MKLEVGMYVRFKFPRYYVPIQISKIKSKEYDEDEKYYSYITDNDLVITEERIIGEPSYNIIDLIEVGDYVNGLEVYETGTFGHNGKRFCRLYGNVAPFYNSDIKSIVTKEQFEQMKYEVK